jgi:hypothetical protein
VKSTATVDNQNNDLYRLPNYFYRIENVEIVSAAPSAPSKDLDTGISIRHY